MAHGLSKSIIIEDYINYKVNKPVIDIIDESCKFYGSTFIGRCQSTEYLIGIKYKCPIIIRELDRIIFFPTLSIRNENCVWINYNQINKYYSVDAKKIRIEFISGKKFDINITSYTFNSQLFKASRLDSVLKSKKTQMKS